MWCFWMEFSSLLLWFVCLFVFFLSFQYLSLVVLFELRVSTFVCSFCFFIFFVLISFSFFDPTVILISFILVCCVVLYCIALQWVFNFFVVFIFSFYLLFLVLFLVCCFSFLSFFLFFVDCQQPTLSNAQIVDGSCINHLDGDECFYTCSSGYEIGSMQGSISCSTAGWTDSKCTEKGSFLLFCFLVSVFFSFCSIVFVECCCSCSYWCYCCCCCCCFVAFCHCILSTGCIPLNLPNEQAIWTGLNCSAGIIAADSRCTFNCSDHYAIVGNSSFICDLGSWSPDPSTSMGTCVYGLFLFSLNFVPFFLFFFLSRQSIMLHLFILFCFLCLFDFVLFFLFFFARSSLSSFFSSSPSCSWCWWSCSLWFSFASIDCGQTISVVGYHMKEDSLSCSNHLLHDLCEFTCADDYELSPKGSSVGNLVCGATGWNLTVACQPKGLLLLFWWLCFLLFMVLFSMYVSV